MSQQQKRRAPWQNAERHYCAVCNAWMGSDRQSILLHEGGKKHQQNVERAMQEKRKEKQEQEQARKFLGESLKKMEQAALQEQGAAYSGAAGGSRPPLPHINQHQYRSPSGIVPSVVPSSFSAPPPPPPPQQQHQQKGRQQRNTSTNNQEIQQWQARKQKREEENKRKKSNDEEDDEDVVVESQKKRRKIHPGEGHYDLDSKTYLEGAVFYGILEADMPVELWTGSQLATEQEKRLPEKTMYWKNALILSVRNKELTLSSPPTLHVAYLSSPSDTEETVEKNVSVDRVRIQLGTDTSIPNTLEEARLLAMGGEEIQNTAEQEVSAEVDEATGLSGWSTVAIKKMTVRQLDREEKERAAEKLRQARLEREAEQKRLEARRLEEAKVSNADDSALGAYDVWGKGDYKGIDISKDSSLSVHETAKKLAAGSGGKVAFRKAKKQKGSRRRTSADDDDE